MNTLDDQNKADAELDELLDKNLKLRAEIEDKLNDVFSEMHMSKKEFTNYLHNPGNFTAAEWDYVESYRDQMMESIWRELGEEEKKKYEKKKVRQKGKKRSRKMIGARKKWIQM